MRVRADRLSFSFGGAVGSPSSATLGSSLRGAAGISFRSHHAFQERYRLRLPELAAHLVGEVLARPRGQCEPDASSDILAPVAGEPRALFAVPSDEHCFHDLAEHGAPIALALKPLPC